MSADPSIPMAVRLHLAHGVLQALADRAGARVLHVKGVAWDPVLAAGRHASTDCDLLVDPLGLSSVVSVLEANGWEQITSFEHGSVFAHAATFYHPVWGTADLHRWFPGIHADAQASFETLWGDRVKVVHGGRPVPVPSLTGQRLIMLVHAARTGKFGASGDVERAWGNATAAERDEVAALAARLGAEVPLAIATGRAEEVAGMPQARLWTAMHDHENPTAVWWARLQDAQGMGERAGVLWAALHVNPDHLALRLGRAPTRAELAQEWIARFGRAGRRALDLLRRQRGGGRAHD